MACVEKRVVLHGDRWMGDENVTRIGQEMTNRKLVDRLPDLPQLCHHREPVIANGDDDDSCLVRTMGRHTGRSRDCFNRTAGSVLFHSVSVMSPD